jgi:hypothetical protein
MALTFPSFPSTAELTTRLDELEARLPTVPAHVLRLQRTVAGATYDQTAAAVSAFADSTKAVLTTARHARATVIGQARAATDDIVTTIRTGVATVAGQARAQGRTVAQRVETEATSLVDSAIDAVEDTPGTGTPYEQWTKAELVERARELGVPSPTTLNKAGLIKALRAAS